MNFEALNWLINSILDWYLCPHCWAKVDKRNINIKNIDWNAVTLDIFCKVCKKNSIVKSEIVSIDLAKHLNEQQLGVLKNTLNKVISVFVSFVIRKPFVLLFPERPLRLDLCVYFFLNPFPCVHKSLHPWRYFIMLAVGRVPGILPREDRSLGVRHHR